MKLVATFTLCCLALAAQSRSALVGSSQGNFAEVRDDVLKSANQIPEEFWSFKPTPDVRTIGQLFAHIADAQNGICALAEGKELNKSIEKTAKSKADIVAALKDSFDYCDGVFFRMTDASAVEPVQFRQSKTRIGAMDYNTLHTMLHYGNLITYMRLKGMVPPSSAK